MKILITILIAAFVSCISGFYSATTALLINAIVLIVGFFVLVYSKNFSLDFGNLKNKEFLYLSISSFIYLLSQLFAYFVAENNIIDNVYLAYFIVLILQLISLYWLIRIFTILKQKSIN